MRTVDRLVTAGRPAGALRHIACMVVIADIELAGRRSLSRHILCLEVALQAEHLIPCNQELLIDGAVGIMASRASFA